MGGLYITPNSSDMSWKRRGLRVSSEALLCIGVATIVASFVIDINPDGSKPNIWILIGGVIMILAASIGWALTFCLIWETHAENNQGSSMNPNAAVHSVQVVIPPNESKLDPKIDPTYDSYLAASSVPSVSDGRKSRGKKNKKSRNSKSKDRKDGKKKHGKTSAKESSRGSKNSVSTSSSSGISSGQYSSSTDNRNSSDHDQIKSYV